jgi:hypothetical protein
VSYDNVYWGGRGQCPKCGRFVGKITASINDRAGILFSVSGICKHHGEVDLTAQDWSYEDFEPEEEKGR